VNSDWGKIRILGDNARVIVQDCIIEKDRGGFLQFRGNGIKCYVDGCIFRNGGNRRLLEGNGRGIDARNTSVDTLIVRNSIIHNIIDRVFRSQGGTAPHNYIEFDQNTIFNVAGRHGCFQFGQANTVKVTNNFLMNPMMLGTTPVLTDEQTQPDSDEHKVFTIDALNENTNFTFGGNNIFWTQDVLDVLNGIDSVKIPQIYSDLILQSLGDAAEGSFIQDPTPLNSVPMNITQYVIDLYANPNSEDMFDHTVEDISLANTPFDFGNLFDFSTFDPCYSSSATSATAGTNGGAIGAVSFCDGLSAGVASNTVVDIIVNSDDHTILEQAVVAAKLAGDLGGEGPFTVFAPTDDAFGQIDADVLATLLAEPEGDLAQILRYHVVSGKVLSTGLSDGMTVPTLNGKNITVSITDGNVFINDAQVTVADIEADNGVVHVINAVLLPPADPPVIPVRFVDIEGSTDPTMPTDVFPVIMGDTTETGERVSNNTIYRLMNGVVYVTSANLVNKPEWPLQIEAVDLENTALKPILTRIPNASGSFPNMMWPEGNLTLKNIHIISGEKGPGVNSDWGKIRILGENARIIVQDCIIEKDRGGFLQFRSNGIKCYVDGCIFRNGGNRRLLEGNGRGIDARNTSVDTLIVRNTVIHNIIDRVFRSQGGTAPHNYIEFDQNTIFNVAGRHGCFQFGQANTVKVTNNFMMNPLMLGTTPVLTDEQTQPDNDEHKIFTIDALNENTNFTFGGNNIFWTQDVLDVLNSIDSVKIPQVYSELILQSLGNAAEGSFIQDPTPLNSVPMNITQYVIDLYNDPTSEDMFDHTVEDISLADTPFDFGNLFDFSTFDPCYDPMATSATAGVNGGPIGAVSFCAELSTSVFEPNYTTQLNLTARPNPMTFGANFGYDLTQTGQVRLSIHSMMGQEVAVLVNGVQPQGSHTVDFNVNQSLAKGIYLARLQTEEGQMAIKVMIK
ncbi:MAG: fasciclin domain-containing protein, partial [Bacteroidota bacterium]